MKGWTEEAVNAANAKTTSKSSKKVSAIATQGERGKSGGKGAKNSEERPYKYIIGIDPGVNTGMCVILNGEIHMIRTWQIHDVILWIKDMVSYQYQSTDILVRVEDARKRKWFGKAGKEQLQGAGSIKRDCTILDDFLKAMGVDYEMVAPKNNKTKLDAEQFKKITGWQGRTSVHARDAAMLVYGLKQR